MKSSFVPRIPTTPIKEDEEEACVTFPPRISNCSYDFIDQLSGLVNELKPKNTADIAVKQSLNDWITEEEKRHLRNLFMSLE